MFRLFFTFVLVFTLRSLTNANESTNKVSANATQQSQCEKSSLKECCNGRDGRDGRDGQNGLPGKDGRDGRNGLKGDKGDTVFSGGNGGENGVKGEKGEQGLRGINSTKVGKYFIIVANIRRFALVKFHFGQYWISKGQKGERGLPGKPEHGAFKFSDSTENCSLHTAGTLRYNTSQKALELCDGSAWLPLVTAGKGHVANNPGRHCLDILNSGQSRGSGLYWIDPNGGSTDDSFQAFCDMETERGGWTLVATKVSPGLLVITTKFSTMAAKTKYADAASHIHPDMEDWEEVMFRFADVNTIRVIYNRKAGAPQNGKTEFEKFLMGPSFSTQKNVYGFYKYSPADHNKRTPANSYAAITKLVLFSGSGISESHSAGTDKWLDMWINVDVYNNNYVTSDDSRALGTKCIAGYCYLNKPIWVMVR